jgi:hypothetical protein
MGRVGRWGVWDREFVSVHLGNAWTAIDILGDEHSTDPAHCQAFELVDLPLSRRCPTTEVCDFLPGVLIAFVVIGQVT